MSHVQLPTTALALCSGHRTASHDSVSISPRVHPSEPSPDAVKPSLQDRLQLSPETTSELQSVEPSTTTRDDTLHGISSQVGEFKTPEVQSKRPFARYPSLHVIGQDSASSMKGSQDAMPFAVTKASVSQAEGFKTHSAVPVVTPYEHEICSVGRLCTLVWNPLLQVRTH